MARQNTVHEIALESLGTSGTVETFLRSEVRHIKTRGYAFNAYLVSRDERHPEVSIYQLTQSDGFAITADAGRFSVNKLRDAVESLTSPEMRARMLACKTTVRALYKPLSKPSKPNTNCPDCGSGLGKPGTHEVSCPRKPSATAFVPVAQAVITVNGSAQAEAATADLRHGLATLARAEGHEAPEAYAASFSDAALDRLHADAKADEAATKPCRKPRKPKAKPSTTAYVPPKVGETWQDAKGERRVIRSIMTEDGVTDIVWLESRPEPDGSYDPDNSYLAMCQPEAFRRWERKMGGKRT